MNLAVRLVNPILAKTMERADLTVTGQTARAQQVGPVLTAASMSMNAAHHHVGIWARATTRPVAIIARV